MIRAEHSVITFYSYKGGTGRTATLANVAWLLASSGWKVCALDWDLEAPGLHRFFRPFLEDADLELTDGLLDWLWEISAAPLTPPSASDHGPSILDYVIHIDWDFGKGGALDFLPAGRQDSDYAKRVNSFEWTNFYERLGGAQVIDDARKQLKEAYDFVLIDSRTGVSDTSGICTIQMPDRLVACYTLNRQSIEGVDNVLKSVCRQRGDKPSLDIFPLAMRIDTSEKQKLDTVRAAARPRFNRYLSKDAGQSYWENMEILYWPFYSFEECLAAFGDDQENRSSISMLSAMERVARCVSGIPDVEAAPIDSQIRRSVLALYAISPADSQEQKLADSETARRRTEERITAGLAREQQPEQPSIAPRQAKFVNPPPAMAPAWFQDREVETGLLARYVADPEIRLVSVTGRGGIGKTAMVCRLLKGLEAGRIPDVEGDAAAITVGGIVYLSRNGVHQVEYPTLVADLLRLLPTEEAQRLQRLYQDPHRSPAEVMLALLEAFPAGEPVVVLLDNLESVMNAERETLDEPALYQALSAVLTAPAHAVTVIATTRVIPTALLKIEPARQRQLRLEQGLGSPDAQIVLRALDDDGHLGLRDAPEELLDGLRQHTRGFPRALEAVKAILDLDETLTPADLLDRTGHLPEDQVVQVLVGEAYELLDTAAQQVMQALAVYPAPVSAVGVDFLLRPVNPTTDAAPILTRLVRRQLARFQDGRYYLHPIDRDYARSQLPAGTSGDAPAAFTLADLQARAADYYAQIRTPRESWRTLDDVRPQLVEFELRCDTGDYDTAATVLADIDFDFLQLWGHYRTLVDLHGRIHGRITDPTLNAIHLANLGNCHFRLGDYRQAIDLSTQALAIARDIGDRQSEGHALANLGISHFRLGDYRQAIDLSTQALAIARDIGDRQSEGARLGDLGFTHSSLGDYRQAIDLLTQALAIARDIGDRQSEGHALANLGISHFRLGDYRQAIDLLTQALAIARDIGDRQSEGARLGDLGLCHLDLGDYRQAIDLLTQALAIARDIGDRQSEGARLGDLGLCHLDLGDYRQAIDLSTQALAIARDIGDRYGEANALDYLGRAWLASGDARRAVTLLELAVSVADATGDIEPAAEARSGLARAQLQLGDLAAALTAATAGRELPYPAEEPTMRLLEGLALLGLRRADEGVRAFSEALMAADSLLALSDRNLAALQARALALSGLAAATGDPARAAEAVEAFAQADAITSADGVAADTRRLLDGIASHDQSGILAEVRAAHDP